MTERKRAGQVRRWLPVDDSYVRQWWGRRDPARMAADLHRTEKAVHERAYHLGVAQKPK